MRLFIALDLPSEIQSDLFTACASLRRGGFPIRWSSPRSYHVTLKFLGVVAPDALPGIAADLDRVAAMTPRFEVELGGIGAFPSLRRPRVVWVGVSAPSHLGTLHRAIDEAMASRGFDPEARPFHPHVTLGRGRQRDGWDSRELKDSALALNYRATCPVRTVDVMESHLSPRGARYGTVHRSALSHRGV